MKFIKLLKDFIKNTLKGENSLYYLSYGESLPYAYSQEEESEKLKDLSDGKEEIKKDLIEHNLRLVVYIARKFDGCGVDLDDLISVGSVGLIKAVNTFNVDKNIKLATYASRCIENEILMHLRKISKSKSEISLDEPLNVDYEGNELLLCDVLGTDPEIVYKTQEELEEKKLLKSALEKLSFRERQIMHLRFGLSGEDELTQKEVADLLGISQSYISRLEKKIVSRLKREFKNYI
ncbi:MAG: sigma-70 family RNA polymerase sigma factor [Clostridiales bacterium]|nr:sigma-70 family RNA polymerase sigma factor [Clostridiales bacterium]